MNRRLYKILVVHAIVKLVHAYIEHVLNEDVHYVTYL